MLEVKDLQVHYGKALALEQVDLRVQEGELLAVIGPNGAGKTTLLRTISGLIPLTKGEVYFDQTPLTGQPPHEIARKGLVHCPEGRRPFGEMTVLDNLRMGSLFISCSEEQERLERVYGLFPILRERASQLAGTMSGGQQQMVAIARALMMAPKLLLLDEPSVGLAPKVVDEIFETVSYIKESGVTVLLVEQNVEVAMNVADRLAVLDHGNLVFCGTKEELLNDHNLSEVYLGFN